MARKLGQEAKVTSALKQVNNFLKRENSFSISTLEAIKKATNQLLSTLEEKINKKRKEAPAPMELTIDNKTILSIENLIDEDKGSSEEIGILLQKFIVSNLIQHHLEFANNEDLSVAIARFLKKLIIKINKIQEKMDIERAKNNPLYSRLLLIFDHIFIYDFKQQKVIYHASFYENDITNLDANKLFYAYINSEGSQNPIVLNDMKDGMPDVAVELGHNQVLFVGNNNYTLEQVLMNVGHFKHPKDRNVPKKIISNEINKFAENLRGRAGFTSSIKKTEDIDIEFL